MQKQQHICLRVNDFFFPYFWPPYREVLIGMSYVGTEGESCDLTPQFNTHLTAWTWADQIRLANVHVNVINVFLVLSDISRRS